MKKYKSIFTSNDYFVLSEAFHFLLLPKLCCIVVVSMNLDTSCHVILNAWATFGDSQFILLSLDFPM